MVVDSKVQQRLAAAKAIAASDLYYLPQAEDYVVQFRSVSGIQDNAHLDVETAQQEINHLKYLAQMNVAEHRRVQLGAFYAPELDIFLRLSTVSNFQQQESLVVRLIAGVPAIDHARALVTYLQRLLEEHRGMIALSGPTGSGKTTLLYQIATQLAEHGMVLSIEDPVEIVQPAFLQLQVNPDADMGYAQLLKAALRHRPDVLLIGEIRDQETAQAACEAALSGHMVLTTIHARSAPETRLRLISLGVEADLAEAALTASANVHLEATPVIHPVATVLRYVAPHAHTMIEVGA